MVSIILIVAGIGILVILMEILCAGMVMFGKLIAETPDGKEMRGERIRSEESKKLWSSPENMPKLFAVGFNLVFIIGCMVLFLSNGSIVMMIFGGVIVFSALFFAVGIVMHEMMMYNQMVVNLKDQKAYVKAIRG